MAKLEYTEEHIRALMDADFILAMFQTKIAHTNWHRFGLNTEIVLTKFTDIGSGMVIQLKAKDAAKVVVGALHFLHDDDEDDDGADGFDDDDEGEEFDDDDGGKIVLGGDIDWTKLTQKMEKEIVDKGFLLLDLLLEHETMNTVQKRLDEYAKKIMAKVSEALVPAVRIELATLAVMNMLPKFGMDSLKKKAYTNAFKITDKIASLKDFTDKDKLMSDGVKVYTSYIGLTSTPEGFELYDSMKMGDVYYDFNNKILNKNKSDKIAKVLLRAMANGLELRYNILRAAKDNVRPTLTRGDSILGTRGIAPGDRVDVASNNCARMMKEFKDNEKVQYFGAKAIKYLARLAKSSKDNLNKAGLGKQLNDALTDPWRMNTHAKIIEAIDALAEDDPEAVDTLSKQKCLTCVMDCLAAHDGDPELIDSARPLINKLAENKDEVALLFDQLVYHMGRIKDYVEKFDGVDPEVEKDGEVSNVLCSIYMMLPDLAKRGTDLDIIPLLKSLWDLKNPISEGVRPKKIGGKKKDKLVKSVDALCNSMIYIKDHAKKIPDEVMKDKIKDSKIIPETVWPSYNSLNDAPKQAELHAKLLNLCLEDPDTLDHLIESAKGYPESAPSVNNALDKHKKDPKVMSETIPLALGLCEGDAGLAEAIDTKALIPILLAEGNELKDKVGEELNEDPESLDKLGTNLKILDSFAGNPEAIKTMDECEGLPYYLDIKYRCWLALPKILEMDIDDLAKREEGLTKENAKETPLLTDFEKEKAGPVLAASKWVCDILKKWNDADPIIEKIKEYYYPLMCWGTDDPDSVSPQIAVLEEACRDPEERAKIPDEQGYTTINAIKMKHQDPKYKEADATKDQKRNKQITEDAIKLLGEVDVGPLFEKACLDFKAATDDLTSDDKIKDAVDKLKNINDLLEHPKVEDEEVKKCTGILFEALKALFTGVPDKTDDRIWHPIIEDLNKLLERLPEKEQELAESDFADKMFAAVLDDQAILNDPKNEDILDDMLKYLDIFAEDLFPETKRGDSIYSTRPDDDLLIGKITPLNKPTEAFAPLENGGKPLMTL